MAPVPRLDGLSGCSESTCPRPTGRVRLVHGNKWTLLRISKRFQCAQIARCQIATFQHLSCREELAQHHQPLSPSNFPVDLCGVGASSQKLSWQLRKPLHSLQRGQSICLDPLQLCGGDFATSRRSSEKHLGQEEEQLPSAFFAGHIMKSQNVSVDWFHDRLEMNRKTNSINLNPVSHPQTFLNCYLNTYCKNVRWETKIRFNYDSKIFDI